MRVKLKTEERWFFCGTTGYGKSYLARTLLTAMSEKNHRIVIIDGPEHGFAEKYAKRNAPGTVEAPRLTKRYLRDRDVRVQMFQPDIDAYADSRFLGFLHNVMDDEHLVVYFDELVGIVDQNHAPTEVARLWVQGRKKHIAAWASCQRPSLIPTFILAQCNNWAIFRLQNPVDRIRVAQYTGSQEIKSTQLPKHYFWYYNLDMDQAQLMEPAA